MPSCQYSLKYPPGYDPNECCDVVLKKCPCPGVPCKTKDCLPKCGNLFKNACVGDFACESLEYTLLNLNSFPLRVRNQVKLKIDTASNSAGC